MAPLNKRTVECINELIAIESIRRERKKENIFCIKMRKLEGD